jgi:putative membrane protein
MKIPRLNKIEPALLMLAAAGLAAFTLEVRSQQTDSAADAATQTAAGDPTTAFINQAARENNKEIALTGVGARKAQSPELRAFAQQLQNDHVQANKNLQPIAQKYGVSIDQPLTKTDQAELAKFQNMSGGTQFDQQFSTQLLKDHQQAIATYENATKQVQAPDVRQYAENTLPMLLQHSQQAETVARDVGVDQATISAIVKAPPEAVGGTSDTSETTKGAGARKMEQGIPPARP